MKTSKEKLKKKLGVVTRCHKLIHFYEEILKKFYQRVFLLSVAAGFFPEG